ncbi:MAG: flagellar hook-length control protein FliK [Bryobacteraceae bacterium]
MKVQPRTGAAPPPTETATQQKGAGESKFGKALKEKREAPRTKEEGPSAAIPAGQPQPMMTGFPVKTEESAAPARARIVDAVAAEIQVHSAGDVKEVTIQFESKVLDGLEVRIRHEAGAVSVELMTRTSRAHDTVAGNVDQLRASLEAKGVPVAQVRVTPSREEREARGDRGGQGRGGRDGRERDRRQ